MSARAPRAWVRESDRSKKRRLPNGRKRYRGRLHRPRHPASPDQGWVHHQGCSAGLGGSVHVDCETRRLDRPGALARDVRCRRPAVARRATLRPPADSRRLPKDHRGQQRPHSHLQQDRHRRHHPERRQHVHQDDRRDQGRADGSSSVLHNAADPGLRSRERPVAGEPRARRERPSAPQARVGRGAREEAAQDHTSTSRQARVRAARAVRRVRPAGRRDGDAPGGGVRPNVGGRRHHQSLGLGPWGGG